MKPATLIFLLGFLTGGAAAQDINSHAPDDAARFGELDQAYSIALSADGKRLAYVSPGADGSSITVVLDMATGVARHVARANGKPLSMAGCDWTSADRLVCSLYGVQRVDAVLMPKVRTLAMDADGKNQLPLGEKDTMEQLSRPSTTAKSSTG